MFKYCLHGEKINNKKAWRHQKSSRLKLRVAELNLLVIYSTYFCSLNGCCNCIQHLRYSRPMGSWEIFIVLVHTLIQKIHYFWSCLHKVYDTIYQSGLGSMISKDYQFHLLYTIAEFIYRAWHLIFVAEMLISLLDKFLEQNMETMIANTRQISTVAMIKQYWSYLWAHNNSFHLLKLRGLWILSQNYLVKKSETIGIRWHSGN